MTDKEKLDAIRAEIHRLVDVRGYDREMANDLFTFMDSLPNEPVNEGKDIFDNCLKSEEKFILSQKISGNINCENCLYSSACALGDIQACIIDKPVSENSKKHIFLVTERMLKEGPIPTLRGKEKADFENEFNRFKQITGMINWPSREEIYKNVILWFIAWSKEHLKIGDIVDESEMDKQPVSEELEEAASSFARKDSEGISNSANFYYTVADKARIFKSGAEWQRKKMMNDVTEVIVHIDAGGYPYIPQIELYDYDKDVPLAKEGDKYKVVLIKEE